MSGDEFQDGVRLSPNQRGMILRKLDEAAAPGGGGRKRTSPRLTYEVHDIGIVVEHPGGGEGRFLVSTRNLSSGGISFLHGSFLHTGAEVRISLPRLDGQKIMVLGKIATCRLVGGHVHEIGVAFHEKIDPAAFVDPEQAKVASDSDEQTSTHLPTLDGEVLLLVSEDTDANLIDHHLRNTGLNPSRVASLGKAIDRVKRDTLDLLIIDLDGVEADERALIGAIRSAGHAGAIVTMDLDQVEESAPTSESVVRIAKPFEPLGFISTVGGLLSDAGAGGAGQPILSELAGDRKMAPLIEQYIEHVRSSGRRLREAAEAGDAEGARTICRNLAGAASGYGFPLLTEAAVRVVNALDKSGDLEAAEADIERVLAITARIRTVSEAA